MKNLVPDFQSSIKRHRRDQQKNKPELLQKRYLYTGWITGEIYPEIGNKKIRASTSGSFLLNIFNKYSCEIISLRLKSETRNSKQHSCPFWTPRRMKINSIFGPNSIPPVAGLIF